MPVVAVAFLPVAPGLIPEISRGAQHDLHDVRVACAAALDRVIGLGELVIMGPLHTTGTLGSARGFGVALDWRIGPGSARLPWAQAMGAWWLSRRGLSASACGPVVPDDDRDVVLVVMGDGSACRSPQAPGAFDPRAEQWDASVAQALAAGNLSGLDWSLGSELQAAGVPVWQSLSALTGPWDTVLHVEQAPQGVGLFAASWVRS